MPSNTCELKLGLVCGAGLILLLSAAVGRGQERSTKTIVAQTASFPGSPSAAAGRDVSNKRDDPPCHPCDTNCDSQINDLDVAPFVNTLLSDTPGCSPCAGDIDGDGQTDGRDIQPFVLCLLSPPIFGACCDGVSPCYQSSEADCPGIWHGAESTCTPDPCFTGNLTAYRPQHGSGYFPFPKTAVTESDEESPTWGPGIRINGPGDTDPSGEDDLIEVTVEVSQPGAQVALRRSNGNLQAWTTRTKVTGTELLFWGDKTSALPFGPSGTVLTVWVEWAMPAHGAADLRLQPLATGTPLDTVHFHTFSSIIMALGGENQVPSVPVDPNNGTFVAANDLYAQGYDVHVHDEDEVAADGSGAVYDEVVNAIQHRLVSEVGMFGYSHGGGSTHDLADRLDVNRAGIGVFEIPFTSYVDGVKNSSDFDVGQELRRPPSSGYHTNQYQHGTLGDFFLDGGPVPDSNPPPTGLDVETTPWGAGATHFTIDDLVQVRDLVEAALLSNLFP